VGSTTSASGITPASDSPLAAAASATPTENDEDGEIAPVTRTVWIAGRRTSIATESWVMRLAPGPIVALEGLTAEAASPERIGAGGSMMGTVADEPGRGAKNVADATAMTTTRV